MPIAVAAGIATGVFSGLLLLRSGDPVQAAKQSGPRATVTTGEAEADAGVTRAAVIADSAPPATIAVAVADAGATATAPARDAATRVATASQDAATEVAVAEPDRDETRDDPGGDRPKVVKQTVTLSFDVSPSSPRDLVIRVDGERVRGTEHKLTIRGDRERVRVVARAAGFLTWRRRVTVRGDDTIHIRLRRPSVSDDEGPGSLLEF